MNIRKLRATERRKIRIGGKLINSPRGLDQESQDEWYLEQYKIKRRARAGLEQLVYPESLPSFFERWIKQREKERPASTIGSDRDRWKHVQEMIKGKEGIAMHLLTGEFWKHQLLKRKADLGLKETTMNRLRALLHKLYQDAITWEVPRAIYNPLAQVALYKESRVLQEPNFYSGDECLAYIKAAFELGPFYRLVSVLYLNGGFRKSEPIGLQWEDLDFKIGRIRIAKIFEQRTRSIVQRTKAGRAVQRYVGMNKAVRSALLMWRDATKFNGPKDYVLHTEDGKHTDNYYLSKIHARIEKKAGVHHIRFHDLRHTYGSHFIMNGGKLAELQGLLGHSGPQMTQRYAHLAPGFLEAKANVVVFDSPDEDNVIELSGKRGER